MAISNKSSWRGTKRVEEFSPLDAPLEVDVAIIGGGMTGVTAAYLLRDSGKSVAVLERGTIGDWASGSTTGFLMELLDTSASELIARFGSEKAALIISSHRNAIAHIEQIIQAEKIECDFMRCPAYVYARNDKEKEVLQKELDALRQVKTTASFEEEMLLALRANAYLKIEHQAKLHSLKYLFALAEVCAKAGVQIFEHTQITKIEEGDTKILHTSTGQIIRAKSVLEATHYPLDPQPQTLESKIAWHTTYVLEVFIPKNTLPEALFEDLALPYHYARIDAAGDKDRLILGGGDHRSDIKVDEDKSFDALEAYVKEILPSVPYEITRKWKGRVVEPEDGIAYIGTVDTHSVFYATGYSGNGLTYAMITAELFKDHALNIPNEYAELYSAKRPSSLHGKKTN